MRIRRLIRTVEAKWARHLHEVLSSRLAVVASWAFFTSVGQRLCSLHRSKVSFWTLCLHTTNTVGSPGATVGPVGRIIVFLRAEESVWAGRAGRLTPHAVRLVRADLESRLGGDGLHSWWHWGTVLFALVGPVFCRARRTCCLLLPCVSAWRTDRGLFGSQRALMTDRAWNAVEVVSFGVEACSAAFRILPVIHRGHLRCLSTAQTFRDLELAAVFAIRTRIAISVARSRSEEDRARHGCFQKCAFVTLGTSRADLIAAV